MNPTRQNGCAPDGHPGVFDRRGTSGVPGWYQAVASWSGSRATAAGDEPVRQTPGRRQSMMPARIAIATIWARSPAPSLRVIRAR